jgi:signal transduction histidine kinase
MLTQMLFLLLQVSRKSSLDSSFQSIEKIKSDSLFSVENPLLFSFMLFVVIIAVTLIYYRFVIIPMRKRHLESEKNLRLEQAELMALFASLSPDPIFRFDENGVIILANNSAHKIFPDKILIGEDAKNILPFLGNYDFKEFIMNNESSSNTALLGENYFQFITEGISKFKVCQVYGRDITELKVTESELKDALVKAEESKRLKEFFLAQISHEIRSPLNVIVGYSDFLMEELREEKRAELAPILRSVKNNSKRLYRTFDLLLNMSQIQTGKYNPRFERINIFALLKTIYSDFISIADERNIGLNLTNSISEETNVFVDHYALSQVFINLIDNAIKYTNSGSVDIKIYGNDSEVLVDVSDTGKGMSKEFIEKIFTPFTQEEMGYTRRYEGTGLGLAIVKSFADLNNTKIKITSEPNKGSKFTVILNGEKKWGIPQSKSQNS